jgi:fumarylacetoacetase
VICGETQLGESIPTDKAEDYIFGPMLFNDWSARDIQKWEYQPLGPFLSKNFASSVSPWVVTLDALEPFRTSGPAQSPGTLPYLQFTGSRTFDIDLEVMLSVDEDNEVGMVVSRSNFRHLYWNMAQQLAHHTVNGCNVRTGDVMASGTISGPTADSLGSMLELTENGKKPLVMLDGSERIFIRDGDAVIMRGWAEKDGVRVGFGELENRVLPAIA